MLFQTYARGAVLLLCCIHIRFELQEHLTNLKVAFASRQMQRSKAEYQELERSKQNKHSVHFFKSMLGVALLLLFCHC
jgi:hypothetical protein